jgi:fimbrial isopeptide formation D2 family protein
MLFKSEKGGQMSFGKLKQALVTGLMSASVVASMITPVFASQTIYKDYDESRKGSITLYKYVSNDGKSIESTGTSLGANTGEQLGAVQEATGSYKMLPEQGVSFMYKHIGNYKQVSTNSTSKRYVVDLDEAFITVLNDYSISLTSTTIDGETMYSPDDVTDAMSQLCKATNDTATGEEAARAYVKDGGTSFNSVTSSYGKTVAEGLDQGLYMIAEVDWEHQSIAKHDTYWSRTEGTEDAGDGSEYADIVSPSSPFLAQIPMNNVVEMTSGGKTYEAGEGWLYDITVYPKNGSLTIHKDIIVNSNEDGKDNAGLDTEDKETLCDYAQTNYANSNEYGEYEQGNDDDTQIDGDKTGLLTHQIDVSMGDTVRQVISSDVPALIGEKLNKTYKITDNMTQGLTFTQLDKVSLGTGAWNDSNNTVLTQDADYTLSVADDNKSFTVELTVDGLAKLDAIDSASYLYVEFDSVLNSDAQIGTDTYQYTTNDGETVDATNQNTAMLTYATDRTGEHDYYSNTCKVYTYEMDITKSIPKLKDTEDYSSVSFTMTGNMLEDNNDTETTEDIVFVKEDEGVYHIYDGLNDVGAETTTTVNCAADGTLSIKGVDARDYVLTEISTVAGYQLLAEPLTLRIEGHKQVDGYDKYYENGAVDHAYVWSGDEPFKLTNYDISTEGAKAKLSTGRVPFLITNEGWTILRTGGTGDIMIKVAGAVIIAGALTAMLLCKKKGNAEE